MFAFDPPCNFVSIFSGNNNAPAKAAEATSTSDSMAISDLDIYRAANLLIRQHGADAELVAARRADELLARGDPDGQLVWKRIRRAIAELQASPTGPVH